MTLSLPNDLQNASTGERIHELCGHQHSVVDCRVPEGDEDRLLSASWDKTAKLWDINSGKQLACVVTLVHAAN